MTKESQRIRRTYWRVLLQAEIFKLLRRGEQIRPELIAWARLF